MCKPYKIILVGALFFLTTSQVNEAIGCTTVDECIEEAEKGDADAQMILGYMYSRGSSALPYDLKKTIKWYKKAAENGSIAAQHNLGAMYYDGIGVVKDYKKSLTWYEMAAKQGKASTQYALAVRHRDTYPMKSYAWSNVLLYDDDKGFRQHGKELIEDLETRLTQEQLKQAAIMADEYVMLYGKIKD